MYVGYNVAFVLVCVAECMTTVANGSNVQLSGSASMNTAGTQTNCICNNGYFWAGGQNGSTVKIATCTDSGSGGVWTPPDTCISTNFFCCDGAVISTLSLKVTLIDYCTVLCICSSMSFDEHHRQRDIREREPNL